MTRIHTVFFVFCFIFLSSACSVKTVANDFNGLVGENEQPVYFTSLVNRGINLFIGSKFIGDVEVESMIRKLTLDIKQSGGNYIHVVQGETNNYWYLFPPLSFIFTPMVSTVAIEYRAVQ